MKTASSLFLGALLSAGTLQAAIQIASPPVPDLFAAATLVVTIVVLMLWRVATIKVMLLGVVVGIVRGRLLSLPGSRALFSTVTRA